MESWPRNLSAVFKASFKLEHHSLAKLSAFPWLDTKEPAGVGLGPVWSTEPSCVFTPAAGAVTVVGKGQKQCNCSQFYSLYLRKLIIMEASYEPTNCRTSRCVWASLVCQWPWEGMRVAGSLENLLHHQSYHTCAPTDTRAPTRFMWQFPFWRNWKGSYISELD